MKIVDKTRDLTSNMTRNQTIALVFIIILACMILTLSAVTVWLLFKESSGTDTKEGIVDTSWRKVQQNGKLVAGTSADYPPMEYRTANFQLDGFDIALMRAIGSRLGVQIEFKEIAFDGLGNALQLGEIDAAISAISVTPVREATFGFSNVYLVSEDGFLASQASPITSITSVDQAADKRVGVQQNSVYEQWLRTSLVNTGKMSPQNLFLYPNMDAAIADLQANRLDLVVLDYLPAKSFASQGGVKLVGQGMATQRFAIGLRKGDNKLREQINLALTELQNDGTIAMLAQQFLNIQPQELPTPPPPIVQPTVAPPPPPPCLDGMSFVADLTYPDYNMTSVQLLPPGTPFQKGWRIRNSGTCPWNNGYVLRYTNGNSPYSSMGGVPTPVSGTVPPGGEYDIYVNLVSPLIPGVYQGFWEMFNPQGTAFGSRIWVGIQVPPAVTPTPVNAPEIYRFQANPPALQLGQCTTLYWDVRGSASTVTLLRDGAPLWPGAPLSGSHQDCPQAPGAFTYEIQATGPGGSNRATTVVQVMTAPPPTMVSPGPTITQFIIDPTQITVGSCVKITWAVGGKVDRVTLLRNGGVLVENIANSGTVSNCPDMVGLLTYRLEAAGSGQTVYQDQQVIVTLSGAVPPMPQANPEPTQP
jgi:polar amino acid transport system substrate-binding protein